MNVRHLVAVLVGLLVLIRHGARRDERGLSQSAESAILLAGAVAIATGVITAITIFVQHKLPK